MKTKCEHRRLKKNYPFGRKSKPVMFCRDCNEVVSRKELKEMKSRRKKRR